MKLVALATCLCALSCSDLSIEPAVDRITQPIANPSFSRDIAPVLDATCASSGACHLGPNAQRGLDLAPAGARVALVNVPSRFLPSMALVRPNLPDSSFFFRVLSENQSYRLGYSRMPLTRFPLPQPVVETIRNWIVNGAPNN